MFERKEEAPMHKKIGILGGLTPESTVPYYLHIVRKYQERFGDHSYPEIIIYSVSFQKFMDWMAQEKWDEIADELINATRSLASAGADFAVIASNTMHIVFDKIQKKSPIPLISIIEATANVIKADRIGRVGLLGTRFTMEKEFYKKELLNYGIETLVPDKAERDYISKVIFEELSRGLIKPDSRNKYLKIIKNLVEKGAQGIVLGCTEIPLLVNAQHTSIKLFDTTIIHADKALEFAIKH
jgi:aspartate racemase